MKKKIYLLITLSCIFFGLILQSCSEDKIDNMKYILGTIKKIDNTNYYFTNGKDTFLPVNEYSYKLTDGQRAFVYFYIAEKKDMNYDYNIDVQDIKNVLTKDVVDVTEENKDSFGNDKSKIVDASITDGYLNLRFHAPSGSKDMVVNLVKNDINPLGGINDDERVVLEFRLKNENANTANSLGSGIVCFKLGRYNPETLKKSGIRLVYRDLNDNIVDIKIER